MKTTIGIPDHDREEIATLLNTLLADEYVLYTKTKNAHWNIKGPSFFELHKFFETQYKILDVIVDDTAERIRSLGHYALGSMKDFISVTHMGEENYDFNNHKEIIQTMVNDHETIIRIIRNDITPIFNNYKDLGTADFVIGLMKQHEKMAWMLRAYLS